MSTLDRLRGIVHGARPSAVPVVSPELSEPADLRADFRGGGSFLPAGAHRAKVGDPPDPARAAAVLGGTVVERAEGAVIVVDREYRAHDLHGRKRIGDVIDTLNEEQDALAAMARAWSTVAPGASAALPAPFLFLDLETTGLFTGAGTQAFLIGCAAIDGDSIRIRQFLMPGFEHERAALAALAEWAAEHGALVTYNGKTFDVPLIETRFLFHRLPFPLAETPHFDMLHPARRLWRGRPTMRTRIRTRAAARSRCLKSTSLACIAWVTCPASRSHRGTSNSFATVTRVRWKPCWNTTAST